MFDKIFDRVISHEQGFQNDPDDRGNWTSGKIGVGELKGTKYGISAMTYPELDIENLTEEQARAIYYEDWYVGLKINRFRDATQFQLFDAAFHHGMHNAVEMLQRTARVKDDGIIGPITTRAVLEMDLDDVLLRFLGFRLQFMSDIKTFDKYGRGWSRRIATNLLHAADDN